MEASPFVWEILKARNSFEPSWLSPCGRACALAKCFRCFPKFFYFGTQVEQVSEHLAGPTVLFIFEYDCFPEAKILSKADLSTLHQQFGSWTAIANRIGASEAFARQRGRHS